MAALVETLLGPQNESPNHHGATAAPAIECLRQGQAGGALSGEPEWKHRGWPSLQPTYACCQQEDCGRKKQSSRNWRQDEQQCAATMMNSEITMVRL